MNKNIGTPLLGDSKMNDSFMDSNLQMSMISRKPSTKDSSYQKPKIQYTCEEVVQKIKNADGGKYKLNFGTQVKSIFTR